MIGHSIAWMDEEMVMVSWCGTTKLADHEQFSVDIYDYSECPVCHKRFKLRQINQFIDEDGNEVD